MAGFGFGRGDGSARDAALRRRVAVVVAAVALLALVAGATRMSVRRHQCNGFCAAAGYADARYTPGGRNGTPPLCHCLSAEEAAQTTRVPPGTQVHPWADR